MKPSLAPDPDSRDAVFPTEAAQPEKSSPRYLWIHERKLLLNNFSLLGFALGLLFWPIDGLIDGLFFAESPSLFESVLHPEPVEIYIRFTVFILFFLYGLYTGHVRQSLLKANQALKEKQLILEEEVKKRQRVEQMLRKISIEDSLTKVYNHRKIMQDIHQSLQLLARYNSKFSIIMIDLDKFKNINDRYGHLEGDKALIRFCRILEKNIRGTDIFARYGGEEFLLLLPFTGVQTAVEIAEKIRRTLETKLKVCGTPLTASFGVTEARNGDSSARLIKRCDQALYAAKENGRNQVCMK